MSEEMPGEPEEEIAVNQLAFCPELRPFYEYYIVLRPEEEEAEPPPPYVGEIPTVDDKYKDLVYQRTMLPKEKIPEAAVYLNICLANAYQQYGATPGATAIILQSYIPGLRGITGDQLALLLPEVLPQTYGPWLPITASAEEVALWMILVAERALLQAGVGFTQLHEAILKAGTDMKMVFEDRPEFLFGYPSVLWCSHGLKETPRPNMDDMLSVASWIWGCVPEIHIAAEF